MGRSPCVSEAQAPGGAELEVPCCPHAGRGWGRGMRRWDGCLPGVLGGVALRVKATARPSELGAACWGCGGLAVAQAPHGQACWPARPTALS